MSLFKSGPEGISFAGIPIEEDATTSEIHTVYLYEEGGASNYYQLYALDGESGQPVAPSLEDTIFVFSELKDQALKKPTKYVLDKTAFGHIQGLVFKG